MVLILDPQPPDVTNNVTQSRRYTPADRVNRYSRDSRQSSSDDGMGTVSSSGRWKVSAKIQQLLNTLKRPKRRPLPEFYEDDDVELEIAANPKDPNAPRPEGAYMSPALGEPLSVSWTKRPDYSCRSCTRLQYSDFGFSAGTIGAST